MNPISKAVDEIIRSIPHEVLLAGLRKDIHNYKHAPISLTEEITIQVLRPRVLDDCNLIGGMQTIVSLEGLTPLYADTYTMIFEIPAERLANRSLISVLSVGYMPFSAAYNSLGMGMGVVNPTSMNDLASAGQRVGDSVSNIPPISNATCDIIGYNTIFIRDPYRVTNTYQLRCILANDENLNNINPRSYKAFAKASVLAVKAHIYNKLIIKMDRAYLQGGQDLGTIKQIVDEYADAEEMYQDYLREVLQKVLFMNDVPTHERFLRLQINPAL